jgi:hypothetical protein
VAVGTFGYFRDNVRISMYGVKHISLVVAVVDRENNK